MKPFYVVLITIGAILALILVLIYSGVYNVAASKGHNPLVRWVLNTIQERSIQAHAHPDDQVEPSQELAMGYRATSSMCVMCHGSPAQKRWGPAAAMTPMPPDLTHAAEEWSLAELVWIVEHGIKMTGMPAFGSTHSREELIAITTFVDTLPALTVTEYERLVDSLGHGQADTTSGHEHGGH
jgi:mono/diheme cytochrome c family protein